MLQILIIEGETGSGKTTQIPQYLKEGGFCDSKIELTIAEYTASFYLDYDIYI